MTVIFDLDGTLLDTLGDLRDSVNYALAFHGYPTRTTEEVRQFVGNGVAKLVERALPGGLENPDFSAVLATFRSHYQDHSQVLTAPYPGILSLLEELKKRKIPMAVVSNKMDSAVKPLCEHYFGNLIPVAIGEREGVHKKPAPDSVIQAAEELQVPLADCVYVGDSDVDLDTARNAGIPCIAVTWGFRSRAFLAEHGANCYADTPAEILLRLGV
jgi:phosphoglycolate phosphatase